MAEDVKVPREVARCPFCDGTLLIRFVELTEEEKSQVGFDAEGTGFMAVCETDHNTVSDIPKREEEITPQDLELVEEMGARLAAWLQSAFDHTDRVM